MKSLEDQKELKVPIDWALMERKWRAVLGGADVAEAHFNLGVALETRGRRRGAKAEYERAFALKPSLRQAKVNLAVLRGARGDARGAASRVRRGAPRLPRGLEGARAARRSLPPSGQVDEAWRLAREALLSDPRSTGAYKTMIRIAIQRKDLDVAKLIAIRAQKLDERDADIAFLLGERARPPGRGGWPRRRSGGRRWSSPRATCRRATRSSIRR